MEDAVASVVALDVGKAKRGDQAAVGRLIRQHSTHAYRIAFAILGNRQDAEDAVQEAFTKVFTTIHQVRDDNAFRAWVARVVANQANDLLRRKSLERSLPDRLKSHNDQLTQTPEDEVLRHEMSLEVQRAIETLSPLHRASVILYYSEEFTTKEVAALMGKPVGSVRRLLSDAYNSLRRLLEKKEQGK